ncbi:MAG TPA: hypothetical protein VMA72_07980 [Streptosporangiaceae bacterium]|nr:hypothetical protein [Streptosporangiaceae bacterium]
MSATQASATVTVAEPEKFLIHADHSARALLDMLEQERGSARKDLVGAGRGRGEPHAG